MTGSTPRRPSQRGSQEPSTTPPAPAYKRRRIALACTSCRNRKSRCNGAKPACDLCIELGFECVYQQPAASNVRSSQGQSGYEERLRSIEDTLRLLVNQKGHEHSQPSRNQDGATQDPKFLQNGNGEFPPGLDIPASDQRPNDDEEVAILDEDGSAQQNAAEDSVDGMAAITDPQETESRFFGPSSNIAFLHRISDATSIALRAIGQTRHSENTVNQPIVSRAVSPITTLSATSPLARQYINIRSLPPEPRALHLIRLFFSDTGMLFPYVHEQDILRTYSAARKNRFTAVSRSWLCLLNSIFAFATYLSARPDQSVWKNAAESEIFMERAQALSADLELKSANLETVQCLLLMAQYRQGTQRSDQAWTLHGFAVRAALQLGLHSPSASAGMSTIEREIRKRTWFGCMMMDRTLSMTFGRPPTIPNEYMKLDLPLNQNLDRLSILENPTTTVSTMEPPDTVCFFIASIQLYYIIGDILSRLYGSNIDVDPQLTIPAMLERTIALEQKLATWKRNLIPQLQRRPWDMLDLETMSMSAWDPVFDRLSVIITLRYLNARILLHRPILSAFLRHRARSRLAAETSEDDDPFFHELGERSIQICEQSAMEIVEIVHKTSNPPALLGAWWFSAYYTFNGALVIFSCILLAITTSSRWTPNGPTTTTPMTMTMTMTRCFDLPKIVEMVTKLRKAAEALQRFGEGTRSAKRTRKTVLKLMQICATLAQCHADHGPAVLAALSMPASLIHNHNHNPNHPETATATAQQQQQQQQQQQSLQYNIAMPDQAGDGGDGNPVVVPVDGRLPNLETNPDDPFTAFDMGMHQYWTDTNLDLFSDLVGVDTGLTDMLAG